MASDWVLPEKYTEDLKDENGNLMSKRCRSSSWGVDVCLAACCSGLRCVSVCSEFKKRQKAAQKAQEMAEKAVSMLAAGVSSSNAYIRLQYGTTFFWTCMSLGWCGACGGHKHLELFFMLAKIKSSRHVIRSAIVWAMQRLGCSMARPS